VIVVLALVAAGRSNRQIALDIFVIWALAAHGREVNDDAY
jgi:hypothetical protein